MQRFGIVLALALAVSILATGVASADAGSPTYTLVAPSNRGEAANGDEVIVTGGGTFSINPNTVTASGTFTHTDAAGTVVGGGTWVATELLAFHSYGCGVLTFTDPDTIIAPNACGGMLKLRVTLTPTGSTLAFDGILTYFCIVGANAPDSHNEPSEEGITLNVPGLINFDQSTTPSMNVFRKTS